MSLTSYLIQVNIYLILFYIFYTLILKRETFFVLNRVYLMGTSIISLLIPIAQVEWIRSLWATQKVQETAQTIFIQAEPIILTPAAESGLTYTDYLTLIYFAGAAIFLTRFLISLFSIIQTKASTTEAWSFFNKVVVPEETPEREIIIGHEEVHVKQIHSADRLFIELLAVLCWFNPVAHLLKNAIKHIHEFIADEVSSNGNKAEYATLLLSTSMGIAPNQLANSFFNQSLLKQRIIMLSKTKSKKVAVLKYGLSAPLFVGMLIVSSISLKAKENAIIENVDLVKRAITNAPAIMESTKPEIQDAEIDASNKSLKSSEELEAATAPDLVLDAFSKDEKTTPIDTGIYDQAKLEVQPDFPGGVNKFREFIGKNYRYPKAAIDAGVAGRVIVQFIVEKDGSLNKVKVLRDLGYGTGEEAIRVIKMSPKWNPAIQNGVPVRVNYVIPFALTAPSVTFGGSSADPKDEKSFSATKSMLEINGPDAKTAYILLDGKKISQEEFKKLDPNMIISIDVIKDKAKFIEYSAPAESSGVISIKSKK